MDEEAIELCRCPEDEQVDDFTVALVAAVEGDLEAASAALSRHAAIGGDRNRAEAAAGRALTNVLARYAVEGSHVETPSDVSQRATLIELVLAVIDGLEAELAAMGSENAALAADLEKREEALKLAGTDAGSAGSVTRKTEPLPGSLSRLMLPPSIVQNSLTMASPNPVRPYFSPVFASACVKASNTRSY